MFISEHANTCTQNWKTEPENEPIPDIHFSVERRKLPQYLIGAKVPVL